MVFEPLDENQLGPDPIVEFQTWFAAAGDAGAPAHDAMTLATVSPDGRPSARMVLLKQADQRGFVFYSNYDSPKGRDLAANPQAALVFYWAGLDRSVRVEGKVEKLSTAESDAYFATRPRDGQLSSVTSVQSQPVGSREELDRRFEEMKKTFEGKPVPRPPHWGGYRLKPVRIEFWQQRFARLNDRVEYVLLADGTWKKARLSP
jgi:pyridoxamine 5'-phosphate oxidase